MRNTIIQAALSRSLYKTKTNLKYNKTAKKKTFFTN